MNNRYENHKIADQINLMKGILTILAFFILLPVFAQPRVRWSPPTQEVWEGTKPLSQAWDGGLNASQVFQIDLNKNGILDLVIFDRSHMKINTYIQRADGSNYYDPQWEYYFPDDITGWLVLKDFDHDGLPDLFTSHPLGIKVYRQVANDGIGLSWELYAEPLLVQGANRPTNVQLNSYDVPAITDIDDDGDIDILVFNFATGNSITYIRNVSVENLQRNDTLAFEIASRRFGNMLFCDCGEFRFDGEDCPPLEFRTEHIGGHSLLVYDYNGDGTKDLIIADELCDQLYLAPNVGSNSNYQFNRYEEVFPGQENPIKIPIYPAAYPIDDEKLLISINMEPGVYEDISYRNNHFLLEKNQLNWLTKSEQWLQGNMIDWGANVQATYDAATTSLLLSVPSQNQQSGRILSYQLINNQWVLASEDWKGYRSKNIKEIQTQIQEIDNSQWLLVYYRESGSYSPHFDGYQLVGENWERRFEGQVLPGNGGEWYNVYEAKSDEVYLFSGKPSGRMELYLWTAFPEGNISLLENNFLGIVDDFGRRFPRFDIRDLDEDGKPEMILMDFQGKPRFFSDVDFPRRQAIISEMDYEQGNSTLGTWKIGMNHSPMLWDRHIYIGTALGGVQRYELFRENEIRRRRQEVKLDVYPNPNFGSFNVVASQDCFASLIDLSGRVLVKKIVLRTNETTRLQIPDLAEGIYVLKTYGENIKPTIHRVLIRKSGF